MKMPYRVLWLLLGAVLVFCHTAFGLSLRDQLALARKNEDIYAQIELIRRILDKEPGDSELRERLAELWLSVADYDMAESTVVDWKEAPEPLRVRVLAAGLFVRDGKKSEAVTLLEGYLAKHPEDLAITRQLAGHLEGMGKPEKVVDLLTKTPGVEAEAGLLVSRALARRKMQDFAGALNDFAAADKANPEDKSVASNRPSFDRLRTALAGINAASAVLAEKPNDPAARLSRAYWYLSTGFASGAALEDAEAAWRTDQKSVAALIVFAEASNQAGRLSARDAREKLEVDVSKPVPALEVLDRLWRSDGQLARNSKDIAELLARARELSENAQQYQLALRDAESANVIDPDNAKARAVKISALSKLGRIDDALAELRALEATKTPREIMADTLSDLVDAAVNASQFELALEFSDKAIKVLPQARAYKQRAVILQRLERFADAQEDLSRAQRLEKAGVR
jgi:tetratricopeptide (TPR) repeat protein